ncbi:glycosyltransferase family 1 protein [Sphingomonas sp. CGMCC 1.13654]|uniref:Glycosyltransferase family 1 protein n=1 Tax=Sphingomonas chungangi TaxID=2683589 RepID=A0A838L6V9_9SPHN|nr:glycosyltransferase family 1 protein [Sphingomonas chungangi]MBA2934229.1 glycosyltransferase family 1 protein [Sphingomonas chungangi]MVW57270.1 glycosyltransferase [Sphingomonas chungangi]
MRIALVSDAWAPQVNGVVRTLMTTVGMLRADGHEVETLTPDQFRTVPCPSYPEIRLALGCGRAVAARLAAAKADAIHIATEGPLGWAARRWCLDRGMPFTTSFHTRFPDYVAMRSRLPADWFWPIVRRFHGPASRVFAATETLSDELAERGLPQTHRWSRGVDLSLFGPDVAPLPALATIDGPILLSVGRVAVEKNIEAFLTADVPGTKVVVGDGPARAMLEKRFPHVIFTGALHGERLASAYAAADLFVFPSLTDTFGLVMIEALASGVPVAAFPVRGPIDIVGASGTGMFGGLARIGALDDDLEEAIRLAMTADRAACAGEGRRYSWERCTAQFLAGLAPVAAPARAVTV